MAAVSTQSAASASLTPPSSSHGNQSVWNFAVPAHQQRRTSDANKSQPPYTNGTLKHSNSRPELSNRRTDTHTSSRSAEGAYLAPARLNALQTKDSSISETGSAPDSLLDLYGSKSNIRSEEFEEADITNGALYGTEMDDAEQSRWIHRDKLAKIESQELQQAGIILPRTRATSKSSRRDQSRDQQGNGLRSEQAQKRNLIGSSPPEEEELEDRQFWDLRTPEEAADDPGDIYKELNGKQGVSRIPVCKSSPVPIPLTHLERDTPMKRKLSNTFTGEEDGLSYSKIRGRSQSIKALEDVAVTPTPPTAKRTVPENSPTKKTTGRVTSASGTSRTPSSSQRPRTRAGGNSRDMSGARPNTRSGEIGAVSAIRPEGDPPWLASMYKPDPRLPPDQQLLPTVAKRLQQEQWEKEGKFGTAYDTNFRPLNDEQPKPRPTSIVQTTLEIPEQKEEKEAGWPLKVPKSPTPSAVRPGTATQQTYSTMPKIHTGTPQGVGQIPNPPPRIEAQPLPKKERGGCGCCVMM